MFDGDGQLNKKNDVIYAYTREHANSIGGLHGTNNYPYKAMCWIGMSFNGLTKPVFLPPKMSFDSKFYIKTFFLLFNATVGNC